MDITFTASHPNIARKPITFVEDDLMKAALALSVALSQWAIGANLEPDAQSDPPMVVTIAIGERRWEVRCGIRSVEVKGLGPAEVPRTEVTVSATKISSPTAERRDPPADWFALDARTATPADMLSLLADMRQACLQWMRHAPAGTTDVGPGPIQGTPYRTLWLVACVVDRLVPMLTKLAAAGGELG